MTRVLLAFSVELLESESDRWPVFLRPFSFSFDSSLFDLIPDEDVAESPLSRSRRSLLPGLKSFGMLKGSGSTLANHGLVRMRHRCLGLGAYLK